MRNGLSQQEMVQAMRSDDARYDGKFFVCVTTTQIFCLPSCKAKPPRLEHVRFVRSKEEAMSAGFRGCKRCRSASFPDTRPAWLEEVRKHLERQRQHRIREGELARLSGVDVSTIRRYFKAHYRTTPSAYHRKLRLDHARSLLARGEDLLTAAFESGFESASGFREAFLREFGHAPGGTHAR